MLALAPALGLWIIGLPAPIANRLLARADTDPFVVTVDRIGLAPRSGLVFHRVLVYADDAYAEPLLRVEQLTLRPRFLPLLIGRIEPARIDVAGADFFAPAWAADGAPAADARLALTNLYATLRFEKRAVILEHGAARLTPFDLDVRGTFLRAKTAKPKAAWTTRSLAAQLDTLRRAPRALPEFINLLAETTAETPMPVRIEFAIGPTQSTAGLHLSGGPFHVRGQPVEGIELHAAWHEQRLHLYDARLRAANEVSTLTARWSPADGEIEARVDGNLPPLLLHALLPRSRHAALAAQQLESTGLLRLHGKIGPAPAVRLRETLRGTFAFDHIALRGVHAADARGTVEGTADGFAIRDIETRFGADGGRGQARAAFVWHAGHRELEGQLDLELDPRDFIPFLTSNQTRLVSRFEFPATPPRFTGIFQRPADMDNLRLAGTLTAENFRYREVPIDTLQVAVSHSNHVVRLDDWHFTRPEGETTGTLSADLRGRLIAVDLKSTMHPVAIAGCVGPKLHQAVSSWRFDGPVRLHAHGVVDGDGNEEETDLILEASGERMGRGRWLADEARFTLHALHGSYTITNLTGRGYDGDFHGDVLVVPVPAGPEHRYQVDIVLTNADFARVAEGYAQPGDAPLAGRVHLDLQLTGLVSDAFGPATRGGGALRIEDGALFRLRLLGGLSDLLSRLVPGFGFVSQTDLTCTFDIENGAIYSEDIRLAGAVISMKAEGDIEFDGRVSIRVEVQLMRRGPIAFLLRLLTRPVTKLFEFQLSGTLADPKWRPVNLPKELFLIFD